MVLGPALLPHQSPGVLAVSAAASCPDVEVIFARGRSEPAGTGRIGEAFVDALRAKTPKKVGFYAVDYPADTQVDLGANDMSKHIQYMAANCPNTRLILGGYSLGAAVTDLVLATALAGVRVQESTSPWHGSTHRRRRPVRKRHPKVLGPASDLSPLYGEKTIDLCTPDDPICNDNLDPNTWADNWIAHLQAPISTPDWSTRPPTSPRRRI